MLRIFFGVVSSFLLLFFPGITLAANEFSSSYDITYSILGDGSAEVTEDVNLKNLTDNFFPSSFSLIVPGSEVSDIQASDNQGLLEVETGKQDTDTKLMVKFTNQQIIGIGKEYGFRLKFKDKGIAKNLGKVWSIKIPKISQQTQVESFNLVLSVPTSFGDPDYILPKPSKVIESGGSISFSFGGNSFLQSGISAIFGNSLNFSFEAFYTLKNSSLFPKYLSIPVAPGSSNQKTFIENIKPRPENTKIDELGNTIAFFKINPAQSISIVVSGFTQTSLNNPDKQILSKGQIQSLLEENRYWDKNNPIIRAKLSEILEGKENLSSLEKAREIDKYVSNFLRFDYSRLKDADFSRFGSLTALNNSEKALSAEFVDLEIALLRNAGIPARQVIGFSLPQENRPISYYNRSLHTWIEIYDQELGWFSADPTWQNTASGAVLFNFNDLNHLALALNNGSLDFILPYKIEAKLFDGEVPEKRVAKLDIKVESEILSGFPSKAKIRIANSGNSSFPASQLKIDTSKILLERIGDKSSIAILIDTPEIPPFGSFEYDFNLKTGAIWNSYQDALQVNFAGVTDTRIITVKPVLSYKIFAIEILGALTIIILFYILVLIIHHKSDKKVF